MIRLLKLAFMMLCIIAGLGNNASAIPMQISGHVLYGSGTPVNQAKILFWSFRAGGTLQPMTKSDKSGYFSLSVPDSSFGAISASKVDEGFPDAELAFYGQSGYHSLQIIDPKTYLPSHSIELQFGNPQSTIAWTIIDSVTGKPVTGARASLQAIDNPEITGSETLSDGEAFLFVLPRKPVKIRISANGYLDQSFIERDQQVVSKDGVVFTLNKKLVQLEPAR